MPEGRFIDEDDIKAAIEGYFYSKNCENILSSLKMYQKRMKRIEDQKDYIKKIG